MAQEPDHASNSQEMTTIPLSSPPTAAQPVPFAMPANAGMMHGAQPRGHGGHGGHSHGGHSHNGVPCRGHGGHGGGGGMPMMMTPPMMVGLMENRKAMIEQHLAGNPEGAQSEMLRQQLQQIEANLPNVRAQAEVFYQKQQQQQAEAAKKRQELEHKDEKGNEEEDASGTQAEDKELSLFQEDPSTHNIFSASTVLICGLRADQLSLDAVRYLVDIKKADITHRSNDGSTAAHWTSKHYNYRITQYLIEEKHLNPHLLNNAGHPALFWACVSCDIPSANILVKAGAPVDYKDDKDTSAFLVACEKGMAGMVDYLIYECGASVQDVDVMGRNGLHWSCANGFPVTASALIRHGLSPMTPDNRGDLPMHLAAKGGHFKVVVKLLIEGSIKQLHAKNHEHKTPKDLGSEAPSKSRKIVLLIEKRLRREKSLVLKAWDSRTESRYATPGLFRVGLTYMFFFYFMQIGAFTISSTRYLRELPDFYYPILVDIAFGGIMGLWCLFVTTKKPGFVDPSTADPRTTERQSLISDVDPDELREKYLRALKSGFVKRCCSTCKILRPNRSKHCPHCDRCVYKFDHHCPFINNCVGRENYQYFVIYVIVETATVAAFVFFSIHWLIRFIKFDPFSIFLCMFLFPSCGMVMYGTMFGMMHLRLCLTNITTNEQINWQKYAYLKDPQGHFRNGYNQGLAHNLAVLFHCKEDVLKDYGDGGYVDAFFPQTTAIFNAILHEETPSITDPKMAACEIGFRSRVTPTSPQQSHVVNVE